MVRLTRATSPTAAGLTVDAGAALTDVAAPLAEVAAGIGVRGSEAKLRFRREISADCCCMMARWWAIRLAASWLPPQPPEHTKVEARMDAVETKSMRTPTRAALIERASRCG